MERFVERFRSKATKARQAQSRVKELDKIERIERDPRDGRALAFAFKKPERSGPRDLRARGRPPGGRADPPRVLLHDAELWLERGEHVSLVGPNGTGKTTLIHALAGERPLDGGRLRTGHNVKVGYLSQHAEELRAAARAPCSRRRSSAPGLAPNQARALLGRFLFSGEEAEKPLDGLSGGERRRLSLAILVAVGRQRPDPRRADQPPRPRVPRGARGRAARLPGLAAARLPRPRAARRGRHAHDRDRGHAAALLRRRLGRVPARARGAQGARGSRRRRPPPRAGDQRPRPARPRSRRPRPGRGEGADGRDGPSKNRVARGGAPGARRRGAEAALAALEEELADPARGRRRTSPRSRPRGTPRPSARSRRPTRRSRRSRRRSGDAAPRAARRLRPALTRGGRRRRALRRHRRQPRAPGRWMPWVAAEPRPADVLPFIRPTRRQIADNDGLQTASSTRGRIVGWSASTTSTG